MTGGSTLRENVQRLKDIFPSDSGHWINNSVLTTLSGKQFSEKQEPTIKERSRENKNSKKINAP